MTPKQFSAAQKTLGLSNSEFAEVLGVTPTHIRRMKMPEDAAAHRPVNGTTERLIRAFLDGFRPKDWPKD